MTDIHIPPEALEAGARALCKEARLFWPDLNGVEHDIMRAEARACFLAMIEAWSGVRKPMRVNGLQSECWLELPLPQETQDD